MKRRQFTQFIALLGSSLALPAFARNRSELNLLRADSDTNFLSRRFFESQLGQTFKIAGEENRSLVLKLTENACGKHCREQFHATFEVSPGKRLGDGIFQLENEYSDRFNLFLTDSAQASRRQHLIATINRQTPV